jgi:hypothetical protein
LSVVEIDEDISIQLEKLSLDSCTEPEQLVPDVVVLMLSISSENSTSIDVEIEVKLSESAGDVEDKVGAVVSIINELILSVTSFDALSVTVRVQSE